MPELAKLYRTKEAVDLPSFGTVSPSKEMHRPIILVITKVTMALVAVTLIILGHIRAASGIVNMTATQLSVVTDLLHLEGYLRMSLPELPAGVSRYEPTFGSLGALSHDDLLFFTAATLSAFEDTVFTVEKRPMELPWSVRGQQLSAAEIHGIKVPKGQHFPLLENFTWPMCDTTSPLPEGAMVAAIYDFHAAFFTDQAPVFQATKLRAGEYNTLAADRVFTDPVTGLKHNISLSIQDSFACRDFPITADRAILTVALMHGDCLYRAKSRVGFQYSDGCHLYTLSSSS